MKYGCLIWNNFITSNLKDMGGYYFCNSAEIIVNFVYLEIHGCS